MILLFINLILYLNLIILFYISSLFNRIKEEKFSLYFFLSINKKIKKILYLYLNLLKIIIKVLTFNSYFLN